MSSEKLTDVVFGTQVKRGLKFEHARFLDPSADPSERKPEVYVVTKIAKGLVYYRPVAGGSPFFTSLGKFHTCVKSVVP